MTEIDEKKDELIIKLKYALVATAIIIEDDGEPCWCCNIQSGGEGHKDFCLNARYLVRKIHAIESTVQEQVDGQMPIVPIATKSFVNRQVRFLPLLFEFFSNMQLYTNADELKITFDGNKATVWVEWFGKKKFYVTFDQSRPHGLGNVLGVVDYLVGLMRKEDFDQGLDNSKDYTPQ